MATAAPESHLRENPFEIAQQQLRDVADRFGIDDRLVNVLQECKKAVEVSIPTSRDDGSVTAFTGGDPISNDDLVALDCDVLAPCALEQVITGANADRVQASIVVEGANGPVTPAADDILESNGVLILPGVLANAGVVVVSYFEWVQGLQEYFWKEDEVNARLNEIVTLAFEETWATREERMTSMRMAAYGLAVQRVAEATMTRGSYP
jgi:glutamate dehydrogenase (NAD(P)+)